MSVVAKIKGKVKFKDLIAEDIDYGVHDTAYRLREAPEEANIVIFYNVKTIGRGIEIERKSNSIELRLFSSSTRDDIRLFYYLIGKICNLNKVDIFTIEGEKHNLRELNKLRELELKDAESSFKTMDTLIKLKGEMTIFGARNPIDIDYSLLEYLEHNYDKYEKFISERQMIDAYYVAPIVMSDEAKCYQAFYPVDVGRFIFPYEPNIPYDTKSENIVIDKWYVFNMKEEKFVLYDDFINYKFKKTLRYDANHIVIDISKDELKDLLDKFEVDMGNK